METTNPARVVAFIILASSGACMIEPVLETFNMMLLQGAVYGYPKPVDNVGHLIVCN